MLKQTIKMAAASATSLSFVLAGGMGIASAHQQNNPKHHNNDPGNVNVCTIVNNNTTLIGNKNKQTAKTGKATVSGNNKGGSANTGNAKNDNTTGIVVGNTNDGNCCDCGTGGGVDTLGVSTDDPKPASTVKVQTTVNNNTTVIGNSSTQSATSGNALVVCNTEGGDATSGNANNSNATTIMVTNTN